MGENVYFVIKNKIKPIYYRFTRGMSFRGGNYRKPPVFETVKSPDQAAKFKSVDDVIKVLAATKKSKVKGEMPTFLDGVHIVRYVETFTIVDDIVLTPEKMTVIDDVEKISRICEETHYSVVELYRKLESKGLLPAYGNILSTKYDSANTSKLEQIFHSHGLEYYKLGGNFAFEKPEFLTAAQILCTVPFKTFFI